jgi:hypothetical protein
MLLTISGGPMRPFLAVLLGVGLLFGAVGVASAIEADDLDEVLGYTMVSFTHVDGEFEGAEFDKLVQLENGMVFEFTEYNYSYAYRPAVAVFAESVSAADMLEAGIKNPPARGMTLYKLVIEDELYDVRRVR